VRLLLDEMLDPEIAKQLRRRGHDVEAIAGSENAGVSDRDVIALAAAQRRALVTNNVRDFMPIHAAILRSGESHAGMVFTDDRSMPRGRHTVGLFTKTLDRFLSEHPADDVLANSVAWIP
jgi:predicted nuclease of predicted toxin-antitoxin system